MDAEMVFVCEVEDEDVDDGSGLDVSVELSETSRTLETPETPETPIFSSLLDQKPPIFWSISEVGLFSCLEVKHLFFSINTPKNSGAKIADSRGDGNAKKVSSDDASDKRETAISPSCASYRFAHSLAWCLA
ncbi:MAG: hypothetical protein MJZ63_01975 [Muribaculaceae bacterium]|nr:hypothetical protein [Muribaculaceae bacterium]